MGENVGLLRVRVNTSKRFELVMSQWWVACSELWGAFLRTLHKKQFQGERLSPLRHQKEPGMGQSCNF